MKTLIGFVGGTAFGAVGAVMACWCYYTLELFVHPDIGHAEIDRFTAMKNML